MFSQQRQYKLLGEVVRSYVHQAEPVGSKALESSLGVSSATIRNDMVALEQEGYLVQPHTSAGRIPTAKGWQFYLDNLMKPKEPKPSEQKLFRQVLAVQLEKEQIVKELARQLAAVSQAASLAAFSGEHTYYTGLSNLFEQPEFSDIGMVREIGQIIDHMDEGLLQIWTEASNQVQVLLGENNPLGQDCAIIFTTVRFSRQPVLLGLLGPMRMDYDANIGRMNYVTQLVAN